MLDPAGHFIAAPKSGATDFPFVLCPKLRQTRSMGAGSPFLRGAIFDTRRSLGMDGVAYQSSFRPL